jgi:hypothetical protein
VGFIVGVAVVGALVGFLVDVGSGVGLEAGFMVGMVVLGALVGAGVTLLSWWMH